MADAHDPSSDSTMQTAPEINQGEALSLSQLAVRSAAFLAAFLAGLAAFKLRGFSEERVYLSTLEVTVTWAISFFIVFLVWLIYLIFVAKDNDAEKIKRTFLPAGTFGMSGHGGVRWWTFLIMLIASFHFLTPSPYAQVNSMAHDVIFEGRAVLKELESGRTKSDRGFRRLYVKAGNQKYRFEAKADESLSLINRPVHLTVYQGIFTQYAVVQK